MVCCKCEVDQRIETYLKTPRWEPKEPSQLDTPERKPNGGRASDRCPVVAVGRRCFEGFGRCLCGKKAGPQAVTAVARKLTTVAYHMLKEGRP